MNNRLHNLPAQPIETQPLIEASQNETNHSDYLLLFGFGESSYC